MSCIHAFTKMHSIIHLIPFVIISTDPKSDLRIVTTTIQSPSASIHIKYNATIHHYVFSAPQDFKNATINYKKNSNRCANTHGYIYTMHPCIDYIIPHNYVMHSPR